MERELWPLLYHAVCRHGTTISQKHVHYQPWVLALFQMWAALHDRPIGWAARPDHWTGTTLRPPAWPSAATLSRRLRSHAVAAVLRAVEADLRDRQPVALVASVDGKPLLVGGGSGDPDARFGRAAGHNAKGYKFHCIWANRAVPEAWEVTGLNASETRVAEQLIGRLDHGGYLLGDANFDARRVCDAAAAAGYQLLAHVRPDAGRGHARQSPHRVRGIALMGTAFGRSVYRLRRAIEQRLGGWVSFAGGLTSGLPAWVRRTHRVRMWVWAKLLINGVRTVRKQQLTPPMQ